MKKLGKLFLASILALNVVQFSGGITTPILAADESIKVTTDGDKITIGNEYIDREFSTANNKLLTTSIINKRTEPGNTIFNPAAGSEEFIIKTTKEESSPIVLPAIDRTGWSAIEDSYENATGPNDGRASNLLDGNVDSIWHTKYSQGVGATDYPYNVRFDLNGTQTFNAFSYTPRQQGESTNGNIKGYILYASASTEALEIESEEWKKIAEGDFQYDGVNPIYVNLNEECTATQLKFVATSANNGLTFAGGAEFNLHKDKAPVVSDDRSFATSNLELAGDPVVTNTTATINKVEKTGKKVTFKFKPFTFKEVEYTICENIVMYEGDHFMRKYLEISVPNEQKDAAVIDYIDLESLNVNETDVQWTIPRGVGGVVEMDEYKANLGQPIYIQGMFFGCEFPETATEILDGTGFMRYYTGKSFTRLGLDNQLTSDSDVAKYVTWQTVAGAARSTETEVIQSDFYEYIKSIATPSEFRVQYNSWFDNMMLIDDDNILESFIEIDKELSKAEVSPLDSYVVDDGWNNYNDTGIVDASRSGTTLNQSGFWEFNSKFPNGLTPSSELVEKFGSNFGVWVGPRGGYNFYGSIANILTKSNKGSKAGGSIDVADRVYIQNFSDMAVKWQQDYGVNYWKWDGYADRAQYNAFSAKDGVPGYSQTNHHMTGGYQNMYHVTDLWEAWIDLFEKVRESEDADGINNLWISLTCYVNPSPWFLQWANSVWIQCTADQADAGSSSSKMDRQITYRDACYYDFLKNHQFQFPLSNLYNHDPIYGKEGTGMGVNSATDEQFQNYLYMLATRGTAFWELYYSDSIMSEGKYEVTGEFLQWAKENYHILKNAKMFGESPNTGTKLGGNGGGEQNAYGYSCFDGTDGLISMRNASRQPKEVTFTFDKTNGVSDSLATYQYHMEHGYNLTEGTATTGTLEYGQTYTFTLQPDEVRILKVSQAKDTTAPEYTRAYSDGDKTITVKFDEKVTGNLFTVDGANVAAVKKSADDITYHITLTKALTDGEEVTITAKDIKDLAGNALANETITATYHKDNVVINSKAEDIVGSKEINNGDKALNSNNGFTVSSQVITEKTGSVVTQKNGYTLGINTDGKAYFTLNGATATSQEVVNDGNIHAITGVKENNGMLKIYVDGVLAGSAYNEENRYFDVKAGNTVVGNEEFSGNVSVQVFDIAYGYDRVAELINPSTERSPLDTAEMNATVTGTSEGDVANIFDNDPTTFWTSAKADGGIQEGDPNLTIDLGKTYLIDRFDYTKRFYNGPDNIWKCTGNLRNYVLEVSTDGATWTKVSNGSTFDDEGYTSKGDGGTTEITFAPTEARYVRISGTASYHWQEENINKYMTVGDVKIFGEEKKADNLALNKDISAKWTEDNSSAAYSNDRPMSMAVDGQKDSTTTNYGEFGEDGNTNSAYLEIDLGKISDVESINLYRYWADSRTYNGTVIALSQFEDFTDPTIVYNSDKENKHGFGIGSDETYEESADGKTITLAQLTKARYIRVYMHGSDNGTTNHVVEVEVMGYPTTSETVDISGLVERLAVLSDVDTTNATVASKAAFNALIQTGYDLVAKGAQSQDEVTAMIESLKDAETLLVDTTDLKAAIVAAEAKVNTSTTSSASALNEAINAAQALFENGTKDTITTAINALAAASESLVARGDISELAELIESYKDLQEADYTVASWTTYKAALDKAKAIVADNSDSSQADVDGATSALKAAKEALEAAQIVPDVDKSELEQAIADAKKIDKDIYTTSTYNAMKEAHDRAEEFVDSDTVTQIQVNDALKTLNDAIKALVKRGDVNEAKALIEALEGETLKEADYSLASWKTYVTAKTALEKAIFDNSNVSEAEMKTLIDALNDAKANLEKVIVSVDKTELENLYNSYKDKKNDGYTEASWNKFQNALSAVKEILNNPNASKTQISDVTDQLNNAVKGLEKTGTVTNVSGTDTGDQTNISALLILLLAGGVAMVLARKRKFSK